MSTKKRGLWYWLLRIAGGLIGLVIGVLLATTVNASIRDCRVKNADLPAGSQLIDVDGRNIHIYVQGQNQTGPAVVFVGCFGCNSAIWQAVQPDISQFARTIAFDPAGYAWSDPGPSIMPEAMADDLFAALTALGEKEIVLVGFSAGMLPIYDFYERYGSQIDVVGMVSVEGAILADMEGDWYPPTNPLGISDGMADFLIATGVARLMAIQFQGPIQLSTSITTAWWPNRPAPVSRCTPGPANTRQRRMTIFNVCSTPQRCPLSRSSSFCSRKTFWIRPT